MHGCPIHRELLTTAHATIYARTATARNGLIASTALNAPAPAFVQEQVDDLEMPPPAKRAKYPALSPVIGKMPDPEVWNPE
jgi:hypothetical protein